MASRLKTLDRADRISDQKSRLNQLIDIISSDISALGNRRTYSSFITGTTFPITSSLFNTIYDQDHSLQSSNALFDLSFGVYAKTTTAQDGTVSITGSSLVEDVNTAGTGPIGTIDSAGKYNFDSQKTCMMREKINIYRQYAQTLLGNASDIFRTPHNVNLNDNEAEAASQIKEALFINVRRLFKRDNLTKGTVGLKFFNRTGNATTITYGSYGAKAGNLFIQPTLGGSVTSSTIPGRSKVGNSSYSTNPVTILDTNASINYSVHPVSGEYSTLKLYLDDIDAIDVGTVFYDAGIIVLDVNKVFNLSDTVQGIINFPDLDMSQSAVYFDIADSGGNTRFSYTPGQNEKPLNYYTTSSGGSVTAATLKQFLQLATIDDILKHFCMSRFYTGSDTSLTFQNETIINSTIFFCRATPGEFNYSTNPTYTDENGKILIVDDVTDQPFSYITTVGLYDNVGNLLAVAKLSRPVEKNPNNELTIRVRLDY